MKRTNRRGDGANWFIETNWKYWKTGCNHGELFTGQENATDTKTGSIYMVGVFFFFFWSFYFIVYFLESQRLQINKSANDLLTLHHHHQTSSSWTTKSTKWWRWYTRLLLVKESNFCTREDVGCWKRPARWNADELGRIKKLVNMQRRNLL